MHDIAVLGVFEESLFLKIENNSVLRNRLCNEYTSRKAELA